MEEGVGTGLEGMRPLSVGEMLTRVRNLLRGNLAMYLKVAVPLAGSAVLVDAVMFWAMHAVGMFPPPSRGTSPDMAKVGTFFAFVLMSVPVMIAVYAVYEGAACSTALAALRGEPATFASAYRDAVRRAGSLIRMVVLKVLVLMLPWFILGMGVAVAGAFLGRTGGSHTSVSFLLAPLLMLASLVGTAWTVWIALHWSLSAPVSIAEELTAWQALKRSGKLSAAGKGRIFGVMFLVALIGMAAVMALEVVAIVLVGLGAAAGRLTHPGVSYSPAGAMSHFAPWLLPVGVLLAAAFCVVLALQYASYAVALTVLYQDQRFRHEGTLVLPLRS